MSLSSFLVDKRFTWFTEDYLKYNSTQEAKLKELIGTNEINVMEIGFNSGNFTDLFLKNNEKLNLTSFDTGFHDYVKYSKEYIDNNYKDIDIS